MLKEGKEDIIEEKRKGIASLIKSNRLTLLGVTHHLLRGGNAKFSWKRRFFLNRYPRPWARISSPRVSASAINEEQPGEDHWSSRADLTTSNITALFFLSFSHSTSHASYIATSPPAITDDIFFCPDGILGRTVIVGNDCGDLNLPRSRHSLLLSSHTWWYRLSNQRTSRDKTGLHFFLSIPS